MNWKRRAKGLSTRAGDRKSSRVLLGDTDLSFLFLRGGKHESYAEEVVRAAEPGEPTLRTRAAFASLTQSSLLVGSALTKLCEVDRGIPKSGAIVHQ